MKFKVLQENLRKVLRERIEAGELTGMRLSQQTGFRQAHISNFLNKKRGLSLEAMDKVLSVQRLSVLDLLDPAEVNRRATILPPAEDEFENVLLIDPRIAATRAQIASMHVNAILKFRKDLLSRMKPSIDGDRESWLRFVVIEANPRDATAMHPRLTPGARLLVDRHYNSLTPHRKGESNLYAILWKDTCIVRYAEIAGNHLILRPHNQSSPFEVLAMAESKTAANYVIGRICVIGAEV